MYFLVLLTVDPALVAPAHEPFVDSMVERRLVLLGGPLTDGAASAAYVLRCASRVEAEKVVAEDPLVSSGAATPSIQEWELVGIDTGLIDADLVVR